MLTGSDLTQMFREAAARKPRPIRDFLRQVAIATGIVIALLVAFVVLCAAYVAVSTVVVPAFVGPAFGVLVLWLVVFLSVRYL